MYRFRECNKNVGHLRCDWIVEIKCILDGESSTSNRKVCSVDFECPCAVVFCAKIKERAETSPNTGSTQAEAASAHA